MRRTGIFASLLDIILPAEEIVSRKRRAPSLGCLVPWTTASIAVLHQVYSQGPAMQRRLFHCLLIVAIVAITFPVQANAQPQITFDLPAVVVAERIDPAVVDQPMTGGKLVRLRIPISTYVPSTLRNSASEYTVVIGCPDRSMRVVDFWPKQQMYSRVDGNVQISNSTQSNRHIDLDGTGNLPPFAQAALKAGYQTKTETTKTFDQRPPMQVLSSSGTTQRGSGVFFKFHSGPSSSLEGVRDIAILAEVPQQWRADLVHVSMQARNGPNGSLTRTKTIGNNRLWMATHQEGDSVAAAQATRYVHQERSLRAMAARLSTEIEKTAMPTILHRVGAALELYDRRIPKDYLSLVIFSDRNRFRDNPATNRLPVDLRVAVLDYWDERERLESLSVVTATNNNNLASLN